MLPALTAAPRRLPRRRLLAGAAAVLLAAAAFGSQLASAPMPHQETSLAEALRPSRWALALPAAWMAAPLAGVRAGDVIDVLAVRTGDRAYAAPVADAVRVLGSDDRGLVVEVDEDAATALAAARGGGLLLIPLLRSSR